MRGCLLLNRDRVWWLVLLVDQVEQLGLFCLDVLELLGMVVIPIGLSVMELDCPREFW